MALGVKYSCEFTDILGIDCKIEIKADPDPGSIITLQASGSPASIEWYGSDNVFDQHIMGSMLTLNVEADSDFALSALFTSDNLQYPVTVSFGVTEFWHGYILMNNYQEPYNKTPYSISITATDALGLLKGFKFKDLAYTERQITSVVIHDILELVGIDTFTEYINLYESTMDSDVGDSMFDQSGVDPYLFSENNCYEALEIILKSLNAGIKQDQGAFIIYRYKEVKDATMYGRTYTDGTTKSAVTKAPAQYINRTTQASNFHDYEGGCMILIPQCKTLYANQDYGHNVSILFNYNFQEEKWDGTDFEGWTRSTNLSISTTSFINKGSITGVLMYTYDDNEDNITGFIEKVYLTTNIFVMQFKAGGYSSLAAAGIIYATIYLNVDGADTSWYWFDGSVWQGPTADIDDVAKFVVTTDTYSATSISYKDCYFSVTGIPDDGELHVTLYVSNNNQVNAAFDSVKLYFIPSATTSAEGIGYTITGAATGQIIENEYKIGDGYGFIHDFLQYKGALNVWSGSYPISTSKSWHTRGATENIAVIELISSEMAAQFARPKQLIDLPLREMSGSSFLSLTGNLQDVLNQTGGNNRIFAINSGVFNIADREWNLVLNEII